MQESGLTLCFTCKSGYVIKSNILHVISTDLSRPSLGAMGDTVSSLRLPPWFTCTITVTLHEQHWAEETSVWSSQRHTSQGLWWLWSEKSQAGDGHGAGWKECTTLQNLSVFCSISKTRNTIKGNAREPAGSTPKEKCPEMDALVSSLCHQLTWWRVRKKKLWEQQEESAKWMQQEEGKHPSENRNSANNE